MYLHVIGIFVSTEPKLSVKNVSDCHLKQPETDESFITHFTRFVLVPLFLTSSANFLLAPGASLGGFCAQQADRHSTWLCRQTILLFLLHDNNHNFPFTSHVKFQFSKDVQLCSWRVLCLTWTNEHSKIN